MVLVKAVAVLPRKSGIDADATMNTLWFEDTGGGANIIDVGTAVARFFTFVRAPQVTSVGYYLSQSLSRAENDASVHVTPVNPATGFVAGSKQISYFTLPAGPSLAQGNKPLPNEVSLCATFMGFTNLPEIGPGDTRPMSRTRGRIYLGPFQSGTLEWDTNTAEPIVSSDLRRDVCGAMAELKEQALSVGWRWVVYSRRTRSTTPVARGWVNDEFDTTRRRSSDAVEKTYWP